jgi:hypothetical protein
MQEWLNWTLSKSVVGQLTEGSNPSLSARGKVLVSLDTGIFLLSKK